MDVFYFRIQQKLGIVLCTIGFIGHFKTSPEGLAICISEFMQRQEPGQLPMEERYLRRVLAQVVRVPPRVRPVRVPPRVPQPMLGQLVVLVHIHRSQ